VKASTLKVSCALFDVRSVISRAGSKRLSSVWKVSLTGFAGNGIKVDQVEKWPVLTGHVIRGFCFRMTGKARLCSIFLQAI